MYKCLLVGDGSEQLLELKRQLGSQVNLSVETAIEVNQLINSEADRFEAQYVLLPVQLFQQIVTMQRVTVSEDDFLSKRRDTIVSRSHQGIKKIDVAQVMYFMADQKYVTVYHAGGQLLLEESLTSLEHDLGDAFVRIHRKVLVAVAQIVALSKDEQGDHFVLLKDQTTKLNVSRRQLPKVRKAIFNE